MWKKSLSRNCLQGENLICFVTALSPRNENIRREFLNCHHFPRMVSIESSLSARARPRKWRERVRARALILPLCLLKTEGKRACAVDDTSSFTSKRLHLSKVHFPDAWRPGLFTALCSFWNSEIWSWTRLNRAEKLFFFPSTLCLANLLLTVICFGQA